MTATATTTRPPPPPAAAPFDDPLDGPGGAAAPAPLPPARAGGWVAGAALSILAVLLLGLVADLTFVGALRHDRAQQVAHADLRSSLAKATAPVGQVDHDGALVAPGTPLALIDVPAIGLHDEVVFEGTSSGVLMAGPGHRRDSVLPGQAGISVLMGRRAAFGGPFGRLGDLAGGDELTVTTGQGTHTYRVLGVRHAGDDAPAAPGRGEGRLTLTTADGAPYRPDDVLRVDAVLTTPVVAAPSRAIAAGSVPEPERALAGEASAWVPLVLWGQLLVLAAVALVWARARWGRWQAWIVGVPVLAALGLAVADQVIRLLPNLL